MVQQISYLVRTSIPSFLVRGLTCAKQEQIAAASSQWLPGALKSTKRTLEDWPAAWKTDTHETQETYVLVPRAALTPLPSISLSVVAERAEPRQHRLLRSHPSPPRGESCSLRNAGCYLALKSRQDQLGQALQSLAQSGGERPGARPGQTTGHVTARPPCYPLPAFFGASSSDSMLRPRPRRLCSVRGLMTLLMGQAEPRACVSCASILNTADDNHGAFASPWVTCVVCAPAMISKRQSGARPLCRGTPLPWTAATATEHNRKLPPLGSYIRLAGFVLQVHWPSHHTLLRGVRRALAASTHTCAFARMHAHTSALLQAQAHLYHAV